MYKKQKNAKFCLVMGYIRRTKLIENVWKEIKKEVKYNLVSIYHDLTCKQSYKITNTLNKKK